MSPTKISTLANDLLNKPFPELQNPSVLSNLVYHDPTKVFVAYIGFTGQELEDEGLRLSIERSTKIKAGRTKYQRNRPILRWTK